MRRWWTLAGLVLVGVLGGCATPHGSRAPVDATLSAYIVEARFALRENGKSYSGHLSWRHDTEGDEVLVKDPFGSGVAELHALPFWARMRLADGQVAEASDASELMRRLTGIALPVRDLARWLTGRVPLAGGRGSDTEVGPPAKRDAFGRVVAQARQGWTLDYRYDDDAADALPSVIVAANGAGIELRLAVNSWTLGVAQ